MIGAVAHNMGQIVVAMFVVENTSILYYVPALFNCRIDYRWNNGYCFKASINSYKKIERYFFTQQVR